MTLSGKLEVLGQISERARDVEHDAGDVDLEFVEALFLLTKARTADAAWPQLRETLLLVLAVGVNWLLAGDAAACHPDPLLDLSVPLAELQVPA